jgi:hypothetical protein
MADKKELTHEIVLTTKWEDGTVEDTILVKCSVSADKLQKSFHKGFEKCNKKVGLLMSPYSFDCYDMHYEDILKLREFGFEDKKIYDEEQYQIEEDGIDGYVVSIQSTQFVQLYMFLAKMGNKKIEYEFAADIREYLEI